MSKINIFSTLSTILFIGGIACSYQLYGKDKAEDPFDSLNNYHHGITIQWIGLVFHPKGGTYPHRYIRKLDPKAYFVVEHGLVLSYEYRLFERGYLRGATAFNLDCANVPAGFFHAGLHYQLLRKKRHILTAGLGPTLVYREDWHQFPEYTDDVFFEDRVHGKWQYRFVIFGNIEYNYRISEKMTMNIGLIPAGHLLLTFTFGVKYML
jgi:hypothetical protein